MMACRTRNQKTRNGNGFGVCEVKDDSGNPFLKFEWGDADWQILGVVTAGLNSVFTSERRLIYRVVIPRHQALPQPRY